MTPLQTARSSNATTSLDQPSSWPRIKQNRHTYIVATTRNVDVKWRQQLRDFLTTGETTPEFLAQLDGDPTLGRIVQDWFVRDCAMFYALRELMHKK